MFSEEDCKDKDGDILPGVLWMRGVERNPFDSLSDLLFGGVPMTSETVYFSEELSVGSPRLCEESILL